MNALPKYWFIKNDHQEVRDYLANRYNSPEIKTWSYRYIGWDDCRLHNGAHGASVSEAFDNNAIEITIEQFRNCCPSNQMNRVVEYRVKPDMLEEVKKIASNQVASRYSGFNQLIFDDEVVFISGSPAHKLLERGGCMSFFEPVASEQFTIGDYVEVVEAHDLAKGAVLLKGYITDRPITLGFDEGYHIINGSRVWGVGKSAKLKLIEKSVNQGI